MPPTEASIKGHGSKVKAQSTESRQHSAHGYHLGKPAGNTKEGPLQQDAWDLAREGLQLSLPSPQGKQPVGVTLGVGTRTCLFPKAKPFSNP